MGDCGVSERTREGGKNGRGRIERKTRVQRERQWE